MKVLKSPVDAGDDLSREERFFRKRRRRITQSDLKGMVSELRCLAVLKDLAKSTEWIRNPRPSGYQDDMRGIDIIVFIRNGGRTIKVPIQVRSSRWFARQWELRHPELVAAFVPLIIVEEYPQDDSLKLKFLLELERIRDEKRDFSHLFQPVKLGRGNEQRGRRSRYSVGKGLFRNLMHSYTIASEDET